MTSSNKPPMLSLPEAMTLDDAVLFMRGQVYPVLLHYESETTPLYGVGTAFLLEHKGHLFAISAQHILDSQGASWDDFGLTLKDSLTIMAFDGAATFNPEYEPHFDLLIRRISPLQHAAVTDSGAFWLDTSAGLSEEAFPFADHFLVFGYPDEGREYDYERKAIVATIEALIGQHTEPQIPGLQTLKIINEGPISYRGFSGSLVIADIDGEWRFAGMVTMGAEATQLMNFIPASVITYYVDRVTELFDPED